MSKELDFDNLSEADVAYINMRPWIAERRVRAGFPDPRDTDFSEASSPASEEEEEGYESWKADELREEIDVRNKDRDEDDMIVPDGKKKADLIAALEADDEAAEE